MRASSACGTCCEKQSQADVRAATGLLMSLSLVLFISWEIYRMLRTARWQIASQKVMNEDGLEAYKEACQAFEAELFRQWQWAFYPTVLSGLGAGLTLTVYFAWSLIRDLH
jgi:hypothetical protein